MTSAAARKKSISSSSHFPTLAFGNPARQEDCLRALNLGFRLIDTATMYERATGLGSAISASSLTRSDVVVVTKIWPREIYPTGQIEPALRESLSRMQIEYVDYLLIHWPFAALPDVHAPSSQEGIRDLFADGNLRRTWRELERLVPTVTAVEFFTRRVEVAAGVHRQLLAFGRFRRAFRHALFHANPERGIARQVFSLTLLRGNAA